MADELLRKRRQIQNANPGKSMLELNNMYCRQVGIPEFNKKATILPAKIIEKEEQKYKRDAQKAKNELFLGIKNSGESNIGRNASYGKHPVFVDFNDEQNNIIEQPLKPQTLLEKAKQCHAQRQKQTKIDEFENAKWNRYIGNHILNQMVDHDTDTAKIVTNVSQSSDTVIYESSKEYLHNTHRGLEQNNDYKDVIKSRQYRVVDQTDESELSNLENQILDQSLQLSADTLKSETDLSFS